MAEGRLKPKRDVLKTKNADETICAPVYWADNIERFAGTIIYRGS